MQGERRAAAEPDDVHDAVLGAVPEPVAGKGFDHLVDPVAAARTEEAAHDPAGSAEAGADAGLVGFKLLTGVRIACGVELQEIVDVGILVNGVAVGVGLVPGAIECVKRHFRYWLIVMVVFARTLQSRTSSTRAGSVLPHPSPLPSDGRGCRKDT